MRKNVLFVLVRESYESEPHLVRVKDEFWIGRMKLPLVSSKKERVAGRLPEGLVYRFPTEAEWEVYDLQKVPFRVYTGRSGSGFVHKIKYNTLTN